jgi:hypothetical protein
MMGNKALIFLLTQIESVEVGPDYIAVMPENDVHLVVSSPVRDCSARDTGALDACAFPADPSP